MARKRGSHGHHIPTVMVSRSGGAVLFSYFHFLFSIFLVFSRLLFKRVACLTSMLCLIYSSCSCESFVFFKLLIAPSSLLTRARTRFLTMTCHVNKPRRKRDHTGNITQRNAKILPHVTNESHSLETFQTKPRQKRHHLAITSTHRFTASPRSLRRASQLLAVREECNNLIMQVKARVCVRPPQPENAGQKRRMIQ